MKTVAMFLTFLLLVTYGSAKPAAKISHAQRELLTQLYESLDVKEHGLKEKAMMLKSADLAFKGGKGKNLL